MIAMSTYETLRHFADSWGLLFLVIVFLAVIGWVFRPGSRDAYRDQSEIPFKHDEQRNKNDG